MLTHGGQSWAASCKSNLVLGVFLSLKFFGNDVCLPVGNVLRSFHGYNVEKKKKIELKKKLNPVFTDIFDEK